MTPLDLIRGELLSFDVKGDDFWGVGRVRTLHDSGELAISGKLAGATIGDTVELEGALSTHPRWGQQFKVRLCRVVLPSDVRGVVGWLAAKLPQVSSRRAEELVERFGVAELWKVLDRGDIAPLCTVDGITPKRAAEIVAAYKLHKADRDEIVRFKQWGLTDAQCAAVKGKWGKDAERRICDNPYALMDEVKGFGWERADAVALRMGIHRELPARLCAGLMHAMLLAKQSGHCFVVSGKLVGLAMTKILKVSDESAVRAALDGLIKRDKLVRLDDVNIYLPGIADAEGRLASVCADKAHRERDRLADVEHVPPTLAVGAHDFVDDF